VDWIEGELKKEEAGRPVKSQPQPRNALTRWYEDFRSHLGRDVNEFNQHRGGAAEITVAQHEVTAVNSAAGVKGTFTVDLELQQVRSNYSSLRENIAVPEGEIFTLRFEDGRLAIFSADQEISEDSLREELLKPVLFPADAS
jgi:hypothetical protein